MCLFHYARACASATKLLSFLDISLLIFVFFPRIIPVLENSSPQTSPSHLSSSDSLDINRTYSPRVSRYDLDEIDACWLGLFNMELKEMG